MKVNGLLESALYVSDLDRSIAFYQSLFSFVTLFRDERLVALQVAGQQVLLLFKQGASKAASVLPGGLIPGHDGWGTTHFAFSISAESLPGWEARLAEHGVDIESRVKWPRGGTSIYFRDPDGHLGELATPGLWSIY